MLFIWIIFTVSYLARPVGGYLFGLLGDTKNRSFSLYISVGLMGLSSIFLAFLPTYQPTCQPIYHTIGWAAPIILLILRILQTLLSGGQFSGSLLVLSEYSKQRPMARYLKLPQIYSLIGVVLAGIINIVGTAFFLLGG